MSTRRIVVGDVAGSIISQALANHRRELEQIASAPPSQYPHSVRQEAALRLAVIDGDGKFAPGLTAMVGPSILPPVIPSPPESVPNA